MKPFLNTTTSKPFVRENRSQQITDVDFQKGRMQPTLQSKTESVDNLKLDFQKGKSQPTYQPQKHSFENLTIEFQKGKLQPTSQLQKHSFENSTIEFQKGKVQPTSQPQARSTENSTVEFQKGKSQPTYQPQIHSIENSTVEFQKGKLQPTSQPQKYSIENSTIEFRKGKVQPTFQPQAHSNDNWTKVERKPRPNYGKKKVEESVEDVKEEISVKNEYKNLNVSEESEEEKQIEKEKTVEVPKHVEKEKTVEIPKAVEVPKTVVIEKPRSDLPSIEELKRLALEKEKQQLQSENFFFYPHVLFEIPVLKATLDEIKKSKLTSDVKELISNYSNQLFKEAISDNNLSHEEYPELFQIIIMEAFIYRDDPEMTPIKNILKSLLSFEYMNIMTVAAGFQMIYGDFEEILMDYPLAEKCIENFLNYFNESKLFEYKPNKINEVNQFSI